MRARTAIAWQFGRRNFPGLAALLLAFVAAVAFERGLALRLGVPLPRLLEHPAVAGHRDLAGWFILIGFLLMAASMMTALVIGSFTESDTKGVEGFPIRMFSLPVGSLALSGWPVCLAAGLVVVVYGAWTLLVFNPLGIHLPLWLPLVSGVAGMAGLQAAVWSFPGARVVKLLVLAGVAAELFALNVWAFSTVRIREIVLPGLQNIMPDWPAERIATYNVAALGCATLQALTAVSLALAAVRHQRHGRKYLRRKWAAPAAEDLDAKGRATPPFRSPVEAQLWFEWRRNGRVLPGCVALAMALMFGPVPWITGLDNESVPKFLFILLLLPVGLALLLGNGFSKLDSWSKGFRITPFEAVRPLTSELITLVKLKAAARSVAAAWAILLVLAPLWLALWAGGDTLRELKGEWFPDLTDLRVLLVCVNAIGACMILTWGLMVGSLPLGLWGRPGWFFAGVGLGLAAVASVIYFVFWVLEPGVSAFRVLTSLPWVLAVLAAAYILKMCVAAWAFYRSHRRGAFSLAALRKYLALWSAMAGFLVLFPFLLFPYSAWLPHVLGLCAFFLVPLGRIALAPLALEANRRQRPS